MNGLKSLNKKATKIFARIITGLNELGDHAKIDTSSFMAVCVDVIGRADLGPNVPVGQARIIAVSHYFKQNGDMCADPDMTFLVGQPSEAAAIAVYPLTFEQALPPVYQVAAQFEGGSLIHKPALQADITRFANSWMSNIAQQQDLAAYVKGVTSETVI